MSDDVYDEFWLFDENAGEAGLPWSGPPTVVRAIGRRGRRAAGERPGVGRRPRPTWSSSTVAGQNAHTWDTVALALDRPLVAIDLPGHGHSDWPGDGRALDPGAMADDVAQVIDRAGPRVPSGGGHVARAASPPSPWPPAIPSWCPSWSWSTSRPGVTREEELGHRRLPGRTGVLRLLRRDPGADHRSSTRPGRSRRCGAGCCTTRCSATTGRGPGVISWGVRRARRACTSTPASTSARCGTTLEASTMPRPAGAGRACARWSTTTTWPSSAGAGRTTEVIVVDDAGHSIQGDRPVELARILTEFLASSVAGPLTQAASGCWPVVGRHWIAAARRRRPGRHPAPR